MPKGNRKFHKYIFQQSEYWKSDTERAELENKITNAADFVKKAKFTELENKISDISNFATKTELTTAEN